MNSTAMPVFPENCQLLYGRHERVQSSVSDGPDNSPLDGVRVLDAASPGKIFPRAGGELA